MSIAHVPIILWCHYYSYGSFACCFNNYFASIIFFQVAILNFFLNSSSYHLIFKTYLLITFSILTNDEYDFLTKRCQKISNFFILPKLLKLKEINEIIEIKRRVYSNTWRYFNRRSTNCSWSCFHTSGIFEILHCIMESSLSLIPHIVEDSFNFMQRWQKQSQNNTLPSTCDIKSLLTNIHHDLLLTAKYGTPNF